MSHCGFCCSPNVFLCRKVLISFLSKISNVIDLLRVDCIAFTGRGEEKRSFTILEMKTDLQNELVPWWRFAPLLWKHIGCNHLKRTCLAHHSCVHRARTEVLSVCWNSPQYGVSQIHMPAWFYMGEHEKRVSLGKSTGDSTLPESRIIDMIWNSQPAFVKDKSHQSNLILFSDRATSLTDGGKK